MYAVTLDTHAGAHRVDTVVVGFDGDFGAFARDTDDVADGDKAVVDFRHFGFEQTFEENRRGAGEDDDGVVVFQFNFKDDGAYGVALAEVVGGNLFAFGQYELDFFFVEDENLFVPGLIYLANNDFTNFVFVFLENKRLLVVLYLAHEVLVYGKDFATAEFA